MFDHVAIGATDPAAAERFYATVLATLGVGAARGEAGLSEWEGFAVVPAGGGRPPTRRLHIGFAAASRAHVDAFWRAGTAAGARDDGAPGPATATTTTAASSSTPKATAPGRSITAG